MKTLLAVALMLSVVPAGALAQPVARAGDRVRVRDVDGEVHLGRVERISPVEVVLAESTGARTLTLDQVDRIERSSGNGRRFWRNFAITMGVTAGAGGLLAAATWEPCRDRGFLDCFLVPESRSQAFQWGVVGGALVGIPLGLIVGAGVQSERWQPVLLPSGGPVALGLVTDGGRGLGIRVSIPVGGPAS